MIFGYYLLMSLLTIFVYGLDKGRAESRSQRFPESTLHLLALLGGWPGALAAQQIFKHKRRKASFMLAFWMTVLLNSVALVVLVKLGFWVAFETRTQSDSRKSHTEPAVVRSAFLGNRH